MAVVGEKFEGLARVVMRAQGKLDLPIAVIVDTLEDRTQEELRSFANEFFSQFLAKLGIQGPARST